jgi:formate hydrogenlyase subunit 3/multisubunit Na+/H+ antiporter MnhD subunit
MTIEQFESYGLILGVGGLIVFMTFIMWDLAKKSNAGKFGTMILFAALGIGLLGFLIKTIMVEVITQ